MQTKEYLSNLNIKWLFLKPILNSSDYDIPRNKLRPTKWQVVSKSLLINLDKKQNS